jgi:sugar phosphate isomerase/epimerase
MPRGRKKQTEEGAGTNLTGSTFIEFMEGLDPLERKMKEDSEEAKSSKGAFRAELKRGAKEFGINLKALQIVRDQRNQDADEQRRNARDAVQYAKWLGMPFGTQTDLFKKTSAPDDSSADTATRLAARQAGYDRGVAGDGVDDNPHPGGSLQHVAWHEGLKLGTEFRKRGEEMGRTIAKAPAGRKRASGNPEDAPTIQ